MVRGGGGKERERKRERRTDGRVGMRTLRGERERAMRGVRGGEGREREKEREKAEREREREREVDKYEYMFTTRHCLSSVQMK